MKLAIISDIHGNLDAFQAVLADIETQGLERTVCLGDVVGYGAQPCECVAVLREREITTVAGNHDYAAIGKTNVNYFNTYAREATLWTRKVLSPDDIAFLSGLPLVEILDGVTLVHGTLYAPELFDYVQTTYDAYLSLQLMQTPVCFLGHSHVPINFIWDRTVTFNYESNLTVGPSQKALVNVGSVGQPRDDNPMAAYVTYDTEARTVALRRVEYDIEAAAAKIRAAGLPAALAERIKSGR